MTEVYFQSYKFYQFKTDIPFNFDLITYVSSISKPSDYKFIIESWMSHVPPNGVANWVVRLI
jgi:alpha-glucosidase